MVNRDTMIKIIENAKGEGRKQGAKEEIEIFEKELHRMKAGWTSYENVILELNLFVEKRLSELESKGV